MQPVELPDKIHVGTVIDEGHSLASVSDKVAGIVLKRKITLGWVFGLLISFAVLQNLMAGATWLLIKGVGVWGINIPIGWGGDWKRLVDMPHYELDPWRLFATHAAPFGG